MPDRLRFERELADLGLVERENGPQTGTREVVIGEEVTLDLDEKGSPYAGIALENIKWTIPGTVVATYWGDRQGSEVKQFTYLNQRKVTFHWLDAHDGWLVWCSAQRKVQGYPIPVNAYFRFDVKAPTVDWFKAVTASPRIVKEREIFGLRFGALRTDKTKGKNVAGIEWDWQVTMPARHGGWIKDLQTLRQGREKFQLVGKGKRETKKLVLKHPTKGPHDQLDQAVRDEGTEATYSAKGYYKPAEFPKKLEPGKSFRDNTTWDSPTTTLEPLDVNLTVDETYKYYVLYKPDKPRAIWVPLAKGEWFWKAQAERPEGKWTLAGKDGKLRSTTVPTTEHPIYESNANRNKWVEVPP